MPGVRVRGFGSELCDGIALLHALDHVCGCSLLLLLVALTAVHLPQLFPGTVNWSKVSPGTSL